MENGRIEITPDVMLGQPVIRGTYIPVEVIVRKLCAGVTLTELLTVYPCLTREDIYAALAYAVCSRKSPGDVSYEIPTSISHSRKKIAA